MKTLIYELVEKRKDLDDAFTQAYDSWQLDTVKRFGFNIGALGLNTQSPESYFGLSYVSDGENFGIEGKVINEVELSDEHPFTYNRFDQITEVKSGISVTLRQKFGQNSLRDITLEKTDEGWKLVNFKSGLDSTELDEEEKLNQAIALLKNTLFDHRRRMQGRSEFFALTNADNFDYGFAALELHNLLRKEINIGTNYVTVDSILNNPHKTLVYVNGIPHKVELIFSYKRAIEKDKEKELKGAFRSNVESLELLTGTKLGIHLKSNKSGGSSIYVTLVKKGNTWVVLETAQIINGMVKTQETFSNRMNDRITGFALEVINHILVDQDTI